MKEMQGRSLRMNRIAFYVAFLLAILLAVPANSHAQSKTSELAWGPRESRWLEIGWSCTSCCGSFHCHRHRDTDGLHRKFRRRNSQEHRRRSDVLRQSTRTRFSRRSVAGHGAEQSRSRLRWNGRGYLQNRKRRSQLERDRIGPLAPIADYRPYERKYLVCRL